MMQVKVQTLTGKHLAFEVCGQWVQGCPPPTGFGFVHYRSSRSGSVLTARSLFPGPASARCTDQVEPSCTVLEFKHMICDTEGFGVDWYVGSAPGASCTG